VQFYRRYLNRVDAAQFVAATTGCYTVGTLERLATADCRETRRAAVLALGRLADFPSHAVLGGRLQDADRGVRMLAETSSRELWQRDGTVPQQHALRKILRCNASGQFDAAGALATELIAAAPHFAEAWNQRAVSRYHRGERVESVADRRQTLELNAYHFDAAVGLGQCLLDLHEHHEAYNFLHRALHIYPDLEWVRRQLRRLQQVLDDRLD